MEKKILSSNNRRVIKIILHYPNKMSSINNVNNINKTLPNRYIRSNPIDIPKRNNQGNNPSGRKPWENPTHVPNYKYIASQCNLKYTTNYKSYYNYNKY